jgi:hypothetical protein
LFTRFFCKRSNKSSSTVVLHLHKTFLPAYTLLWYEKSDISGRKFIFKKSDISGRKFILKSQNLSIASLLRYNDCNVL